MKKFIASEATATRLLAVPVMVKVPSPGAAPAMLNDESVGVGSARGASEQQLRLV